MSVAEKPVVDDVDGDVLSDLDNSYELDPNSTGGERAGIYLAALIALAVPSLIVLAFFLPNRPSSVTVDTEPVLESTPAGLDSSEVPEAALDDESSEEEIVSEESATEVAGAVEVNPDASTVAVDADEGEPTEKPAESDSSAPETIDFDLVVPDSINVFVYDETPPSNGEYSFALRLKSTATPFEIETHHFSVVVYDADGVAAATSTRFLHETLPVDSSALATVRAADTGATQNFVVIALGTKELARVPIEFE